MSVPFAACGAAARHPDRALATNAIHGADAICSATGAILAPIHQTATFVQPELGVDRGFTYSRTGNPTVAALERAIATLEGAGRAFAFRTGMAALTALCLAELRAGDHVVVGDAVYGGTVRLLRDVLARFGVHASFVPASDPAALRAACTARTTLVIVESPANPTLALTDLHAAATAAHAAGARLVVDNTFLTPALQQPFDFGADIVVYSTTKFYEGHNATVGGALVARDDDVAERIAFVQNACGLAQAPFDAWLTLRGIRTLPLRMRAHSASAAELAGWLETHPAVARVAYPDLTSFPHAALARRQHRGGGGGVVAFELHGGRAAAEDVLRAVELCALAESLGAVETLLTHPATMTHGDVPAAQCAAAGITDGLLRLSVGLEDPADLRSDLGQALGAIERVAVATTGGGA